MVCVFCGQKTEVINSRRQKRSNQVWRRRRCSACGQIFTTEEAANLAGVWQVITPHKQLSAFQRDKLLLSLYGSCLHRKDALRDAQGLTNTVIAALKPDKGAITAHDIAKTVQTTLLYFDTVAHAHYKAFHGPTSS